MSNFRYTKKNQHITFEDQAETLSIDLPELLSRKVVDTTINEIVFMTKKETDKEKSYLWERFIEELKEYNDLEKIHKTDTKYKSKYGKSIVGFDLWDGHPILWIADNVASNDALRINGMKQWAIVCNRTYSTMNGGTPLLKNQLVITSKDISYLFLAGFGVSPKNVKDVNNGKTSTKEVLEGWVPLKWCNVKLPNYIVDNFKVGTHPHNYGVLPAVEMLNKDFIDSDAYNWDINYSSCGNDVVYSDWWPAIDIIALLDGFLQFFGIEMVLDHTRLIGTFSTNDINKFIKGNNDDKKDITRKIDDAVSRLKGMDETEKSAIRQRLILRSLGGEGAQLDKMQTTLRSLEFTQTLDQLITLAFKISGYSWDSDSAKVYENVSQTMNSSRGVYESTKEKIVLFERQWKDFYSRVAFAWFKYMDKPFYSLNECKLEFEKYVDFRIVSNVLQQENNDYQKVVELKMNNLISTSKAIKDLNPSMTEEEIKEELLAIEQENNKNNHFDNFNNQDFLGYEENENPARDNNGEKNINGDN